MGVLEGRLWRRRRQWIYPAPSPVGCVDEPCITEDTDYNLDHVGHCLDAKATLCFTSATDFDFV